MPQTVRIIRHVTFTEDVDAGHPAVAAACEGRPVNPSLLPPTLLGREPAAISGSTWLAEAGGRSFQIRLAR